MSRPTSLPSICAPCRARLARSVLTHEYSPRAAAASYNHIHLQIRGKKKNAKARTSISVRLVQDMEGFGRAGTIIPLPIGQMRNYFYPQRLADYVTQTEAKELKRVGFVAQRDASFGRASEEKDDGAGVKDVAARMLGLPGRETGRRRAVRVEVEMLKPQEAHTLLSTILPPMLTFYRTPIDASTTSGKAPAPTPTPQPTARGPATPSPTSSFPTEPGPSTNTLSPTSSSGPSPPLYPSTPTSADAGRATPIYGSVTTADVCTSLKALIATHEEAAGRVVIDEADVSFVTASLKNVDDTESRVKCLGEYGVEVRIRGAEGIRRSVRVLPVSQAPGDVDVDEARGRRNV